MSVPAAVRVLPSSRPEPRTWLGPSARREAASAAPEDPVARPRPGQVQRVGRSWGAQVPDTLPDAARWSGWFALALAEAVLGRRPASQLAGWVNAEVLASLNRRQRLRPAGDAAPRTVLLSGRVQHPGPRSAEGCAVLRSGQRLLVLAYRLEARQGQWLCTALEAGLTSGARRRPTRPGGGAASDAAADATPTRDGSAAG